MDLKDWSSKNRCEISLSKDDELQIQVAHESGQIDLTMAGKNGSEPYTGNNLKSCLFTVKVSETDNYQILITGKGTTEYYKSSIARFWKHKHGWAKLFL